MKDAYTGQHFTSDFDKALTKVRPIPGDILGMDYGPFGLVAKMILHNIPERSNSYEEENEYQGAEV